MAFAQTNSAKLSWAAFATGKLLSGWKRCWSPSPDVTWIFFCSCTVNKIRSCLQLHRAVFDGVQHIGCILSSHSGMIMYSHLIGLGYLACTVHKFLLLKVHYNMRTYLVKVIAIFSCFSHHRAVGVLMRKAKTKHEKLIQLTETNFSPFSYYNAAVVLSEANRAVLRASHLQQKVSSRNDT